MAIKTAVRFSWIESSLLPATDGGPSSLLSAASTSDRGLLDNLLAAIDANMWRFLGLPPFSCPARVFSACHRLKMVRVHTVAMAASASAYVVKLQAVRDRSDQLLVNDAMGKFHNSVHMGDAIARLFGDGFIPEPTPRLGFNGPSFRKGDVGHLRAALAAAEFVRFLSCFVSVKGAVREPLSALAAQLRGVTLPGHILDLITGQGCATPREPSRSPGHFVVSIIPERVC